MSNRRGILTTLLSAAMGILFFVTVFLKLGVPGVIVALVLYFAFLIYVVKYSCGK